VSGLFCSVHQLDKQLQQPVLCLRVLQHAFCLTEYR
jgi:hypothetical protein